MSKVGIPVAFYHPGTTADYVAQAFTQLGHQVEILNEGQFFEHLPENRFDFYFIVDSGLPLNLFDWRLPKSNIEKVMYWFIDFRNNRDCPTRIPNDLICAKIIDQHKGWIFQAQFEDYEYCKSVGIERVSFLPLAADSDIWSDTPVQKKIYDFAFVGKIWDITRMQALDELKKANFKLGFMGPGKLWKEEAAKLLRQAKIGFNISSHFGSERAFDVNMRVFESLSCGIPLLTNKVPGLEKIFGQVPFIKTYSNLAELAQIAKAALQDQEFLNSGALARDWVLNNATYGKRIQQAMALGQTHLN